MTSITLAASISVEDRGPGISPDDLPHIFDAFYRGEAVRNSQIPGVGLGLSLVRRIMEAHHGTVEVTRSAVSVPSGALGGGGGFLAAGRGGRLVGARRWLAMKILPYSVS